MWTYIVKERLATKYGSSETNSLLQYQMPDLQTLFSKVLVTEKKNGQKYLHYYLYLETGEYKDQDHELSEV